MFPLIAKILSYTHSNKQQHRPYNKPNSYRYKRHHDKNLQNRTHFASKMSAPFTVLTWLNGANAHMHNNLLRGDGQQVIRSATRSTTHRRESNPQAGPSADDGNLPIDIAPASPAKPEPLSVSYSLHCLHTTD